MRTLYPTQIGTIPTGAYATYPSQLVFGRDVSAVTANDVGFGQAGRPDFVEKMTIYLTRNTSSDKTINATLTNKSNLSINVEDLITISNANFNAPATFSFTLKEVDVCEGGIAKKMCVLGSQTYLP